MADGAIVLGDLLAARAGERPDAPAIVFDGGQERSLEWTWGEAFEKARAHAAALQALGLRQGELVLSWLPNGPLAVLNALALPLLGAVHVPINTAYRGGLLAHVLKTTGASTMIAHGALLERLGSVETGALRRVVVVGEERPSLDGLELLGREALEGDPGRLRPPERPVHPHDLEAVLYTSGTTGPSKGVLASYRHLHAAALGFRCIGPGDRSLNMLPMFHVGGTLSLYWALIHGGVSIQAQSFRTSEFWPLVRRHRVTTTGLLGAMAQFLADAPEQADDRDHTLRSVIIAPFDEKAVRFGARFGVDVYTEFNMTELSVPLWAGPNPRALGACGRIVPGVSLRIVDERDRDVAEGAVGELIVRPDDPWTISRGYFNDPKATEDAHRGGWFRTGDLFRRDAAGDFFFVDRKKDVVRRRGENISSFEVEAALLLHPAVAEAAVVAAPGDGGEDEVLAVLVAADAAALDPAALVDFLRPHLPPFMIPRFVRVVEALPRTPTHKVEKHRLRAEGLTADTWDRETAGIVVKRETLEGRG